MRGKLYQFRHPSEHLRIIPAHAGQTAFGNASAYAGPDHPRACGANVVAVMANEVVPGSSPRMRGKPRSVSHVSAPGRIIPAHAGQTLLCFSRPVPGSDHPRACGANGTTKRLPITLTGSSPRMRGKPAVFAIAEDTERIIPAHAGQTSTLPRLAHLIADHPRACGANGVWGTFNIRGHGSSPRMRGKHRLSVRHWWMNRIIPAHAGQTRHRHP